MAFWVRELGRRRRPWEELSKLHRHVWAWDRWDLGYGELSVAKLILFWHPEGRFVESSVRPLFYFILLCVGLTTVRLLRRFVSSVFHSMLSFFTTFICTWDMDMSTSTTNTKAYRDISLLMISVSQSGYKQIVNRRSVMNCPDAFLL